MNNGLRLDGLTLATLDSWSDSIRLRTGQVRRLFIAVSGYEQRSIYWASEIRKHISKSDPAVWKIIGFTNLKDICSRLFNDKFYTSNGAKIREFPADDAFGIQDYVVNAISKMLADPSGTPIEVHIDYSSMPRLWYCSLFKNVQSALRHIDKLFFWYSGGTYDGTEFPTAGTSDVSLFSGRPSLTPRARTHLFGLGFDRIRASAIFRVLDPQNLVCFYADPGIRSENVSRVSMDNRDLMSTAKLVFTAPVGDFPTAFSRIAEVAREFSAKGDVIIVPDGPKPLILASSLVPLFLNRNGIVSLHVKRRKGQQPGIRDVAPNGQIYGFSVNGVREYELQKLGVGPVNDSISSSLA